MLLSGRVLESLVKTNFIRLASSKSQTLHYSSSLFFWADRFSITTQKETGVVSGGFAGNKLWHLLY